MTTATQELLPVLIRTYFVRGSQPKHWRHHFAIQDPPTSGFGYVVLLRGDKRSTLLCPYTLYSFQAPNHSGEIQFAKDVEVSPEKLAEVITASWKGVAAIGLQRDYALAAAVLAALGAEVPKLEHPAVVDGEGPSAKVQGGKPVIEANLRPVKPTSKRGEVARFFTADKPQSLHEAMARLGLTRSGVLSHLFCLHRDHGVGYTLANDCASLQLPAGFDLFAYIEPERKAPPAARADAGPPKEIKKRTSGKPVVVEALAPIPRPGRRADVAELFITGFFSMEEAQKRLELNRSAVLSHLFTINKENGLGYELSEDGSQARLIVPEGHTLFCVKQPRPKKEEGMI